MSRPWRAFYEYRPTDDSAAVLWRLLSLTPEDMGPCRARFRGRLPVGMAVGVTAVMGAVFTLIGVLIRAVGATWGEVGVVVLIGLGIGLLTAGMLALGARSSVAAVHCHGVVVSLPPSRGRVIPFASIDPGRVFVTRGEFLGRSLTTVMHRSRYVAGPVVVLNGLDRDNSGVGVAENLFAARRPDEPVGGPFGWWVLSAPDPAALLQCLEAAMVADGYPAAGLAPFVLSRRFTARDLRSSPMLRQQRGLADPVLGLPS